MNLYQKTIQICEENNIKPARSKGQNFLINEKVYDDIVATADLKSDDVIMEVGPGLGFLTRKLAQKVKKVIAIELDDKLANILKYNFKKEGIKNVEILNENVLDINLSAIGQYKVVANLPYNITSVFLRKFLELPPWSAEKKDKKGLCQPHMMVLMLQKEVAERICAQPGEMSLLSISVQYFADVEIIEFVSKGDFYPAPEVDSAIIKIKTHPNLPLGKGRGYDESISLAKGEARSDSIDYNKLFFRLVKHGFSSKRKMLKNNLAGGYHISQTKAAELIQKAGFNEKIRAQELSVEDWKKLLEEFEKYVII